LNYLAVSTTTQVSSVLHAATFAQSDSGKAQQNCWPCPNGLAWVDQVAECSQFPGRLVTINHFFYLADGVESIEPGHSSVQNKMKPYAQVSLDEFVTTADGAHIIKQIGPCISTHVPVESIRLLSPSTVSKFCVDGDGERARQFAFTSRPAELTVLLLVSADDMNLRGHSCCS
jgi:hypothetical protein